MKHYNHPFRTDYTPHGFKKEKKLQPLFDVVGTIAVTAFFVWAMCFAGQSLDNQPSKALQDAAQAATADFSKSMADAKVCRAQAPGSLVRYTADGQLVCMPAFQANRF